MAGPDFIIIGAMKCGTSTLAAQLGLQPGIFMTDPKEPNFFSDDAVFARGQGWYEALFADAADGDIKGEASTHYAKLPTHPHTLARMSEMLESPKLIYLIRDPVARAVSHYIHEWSMIDYSCYAMQIAPYVKQFGKANLLILSLEKMKQAPQATLEQVCEFLGYGGTAQWREESAQVNASAERIRRFPMHKLIFDNPVATRLRRALIPQALRDRIKAARQMHERPELSAALRAGLEQRFAQDYVELRKIFPERDDLCASYPFVTDVR